MSNIPAELKYIASHEWLRLEDDGTITIGITDHAQDLLGDVVLLNYQTSATSSLLMTKSQSLNQ